MLTVLTLKYHPVVCIQQNQFHFSGVPFLNPGTGVEIIGNCPEEQAYVFRLFQYMTAVFNCPPEEPTILETMLDIISDIFEFLMENAPVIGK